MQGREKVTVDDCRIIKLPKIHDPRGNLSFIEEENHIPFKIARSYWIYDVPGGQVRGSHAYRELKEFIVAISGSFDVIIDDGRKQKTFQLNRSYYGLFVPNLLWRSLENFSTNSLCLVLASLHYSEADYIRDYNTFLNIRL
ncbi:FdtA/QdtA family cupin domain-containing protein [uncultured Desulfobacter sp.]|uniref:sugar 3,4-ketoisomerase n=1 Tax=uncultured Desulfobacter sp. TaxID=240139 RepID=UPI002AA7F722|nr:FdtA/QdtA family cupin domain-containing protein [uncultured Desulfobacter sp.]